MVSEHLAVGVKLALLNSKCKVLRNGETQTHGHQTHGTDWIGPVTTIRYIFVRLPATSIEIRKEAKSQISELWIL
jgi:hypothetical protein